MMLKHNMSHFGVCAGEDALGELGEDTAQFLDAGRDHALHIVYAPALEGQRRRVALFCNDGEGAAALKAADSLREAGYSVGLFPRPKKLGKFLGRLEEQGFDGYLVCGEGTEPKWLGGSE